MVRPRLALGEGEIKHVLEKGELNGVKLFAVVGEAKTALPEPAARGALIEQQLSAVKRRKPIFGAIIIHENASSVLNSNFESFGRKIGRVVTFDLLPRPEHARLAVSSNTWHQTVDGSVAHCSIALDEKGRKAFILQVQGNIAPVVNFPGFEEIYNQKMGGYACSLDALFLAAHAYCAEKGLVLHHFRPNLYSQGYISAENQRVLSIVERIRAHHGTLRSIARKLFETRETNWSAPENRDLAGKIEDSRLVLSADRLQPKDLLAILGPKTRKTKAR